MEAKTPKKQHQGKMPKILCSLQIERTRLLRCGTGRDDLAHKNALQIRVVALWHPETESVPSRRRHRRRRKSTEDRPTDATDLPLRADLLQGEGGLAVSRPQQHASSAQSAVGHAGRAVAVCEPEWSR